MRYIDCDLVDVFIVYLILENRFRARIQTDIQPQDFAYPAYSLGARV